eukprot:14385149-Alexandrium_andersonii.AAC.1
MSASLVGSEMCIRDRHRALRGGACARRLLALALVRACWLSLQLGSGPVSYTHLTLPTICSV